MTPISILLIWNLSFFLQHPDTPFTRAMACGWIQMSACCTSVWLLIGVWISRFKDIMARDRHVRIMDIKAMDTVMSSKWKIRVKKHVVVHANVILFKFLSYTKKHVGSNPIFYTIDFRTLEHLAGSNQLRDERLLEWAVEPSDCFVVFPTHQEKMKVSSGRSKRTPGRCLDAIKIKTMKSRKKEIKNKFPPGVK